MPSCRVRLLFSIAFLILLTADVLAQTTPQAPAPIPLPGETGPAIPPYLADQGGGTREERIEAITPTPPSDATLQLPAQGQAEGLTPDVLVRMDRIEARLETIDSRIPATEQPANAAAPISTGFLLGVNLVTLALIVYLLWKTRGGLLRAAGREDSKPLSNVKDYLRRYLAQGYNLQGMKTFLITQGYPRDLIERAAREVQGEGF